jgi:hypothetical protein
VSAGVTCSISVPADLLFLAHLRPRLKPHSLVLPPCPGGVVVWGSCVFRLVVEGEASSVCCLIAGDVFRIGCSGTRIARLECDYCASHVSKAR